MKFEFKDATIVPAIKTFQTRSIMHGVFDCNKQIIPTCNERFIAPYVEPTEYQDKTVIFGGFLINHFGHFLLESLARYYFFKDFPDYPIVFTLDKSLNNWQKQIFDLLSIKNEIIFLDHPTKFKSVICPPPGFYYDKYLSKDQAEALEAYEGKLSDRKIYISRSKLDLNNTGGCLNEKELENLLKAQGYEIFFPEEHSIEEQLHTISTSKEVVAIEGSALHILLLLRNYKGRVFVIPRMKTNNYDLIAQQKNLNYFKFPCNLNFEEGNLSQNQKKFSIDLTEFSKLFEQREELDNSNQYKTIELRTVDDTNQLLYKFMDSLQKKDKEAANKLYSNLKSLDFKFVPDHYYSLALINLDKPEISLKFINKFLEILPFREKGIYLKFRILKELKDYSALVDYCKEIGSTIKTKQVEQTLQEALSKIKN